ncbi:MAG: hypothetical protein ACKV2U_00855 [Bryobacteraceae bacterium]
MTPEQKVDIARRNGAKSHGPKTAEGKAATSRNALKHGRYATLALESAVHRAVAGHEDKERFLRLARRNLDQLQPQSPIERDLAIALADTQWRYERWNHAETHVLAYEHREIEALFEERKKDRRHDTYTVDELHARAARALACRAGGDFMKRLNAERSRLIRERAQHFRLLKTIRKEFPATLKQTKVQTKEQTNDPEIPAPVSD